MRSPILNLENAIAASAFRIAPERASELARKSDLKTFSLALSNDKGFRVRVNTQSHEATLPIAALEFLWCCAHAFYVLHQEYVKAQQSGTDTFNLNEAPRTRRAIDS